MYEVNEEMIMYAFRYALGRMTYAVSTVSDYLIQFWHRFKPHTREQIIKEIEEAIGRNQAGMECDVVRWKAVLLLENATKEDLH